jgi:hypothetical protein
MVTLTAMCCSIAVYAQFVKKVQHVGRVISIDAETPQQIGLLFVGIGK